MFLQVLHLNSNASYTFSSKGVSNKLYVVKSTLIEITPMKNKDVWRKR